MGVLKSVVRYAVKPAATVGLGAVGMRLGAVAVPKLAEFANKVPGASMIPGTARALIRDASLAAFGAIGLCAGYTGADYLEKKVK